MENDNLFSQWLEKNPEACSLEESFEAGFEKGIEHLEKTKKEISDYYFNKYNKYKVQNESLQEETTKLRENMHQLKNKNVKLHESLQVLQSIVEEIKIEISSFKKSEESNKLSANNQAKSVKNFFKKGKFFK